MLQKIRIIVSEMSKRVLLCSPYGNGDNVVVGGIAVWGRNVISYSKSIDSPIEIIPVSFDRHSYIGNSASLLARLYRGVIELSKAMKTSILYIEKGKIDVVHICTSASFSLIKDYILIKKAKKRNVKTVVHFHFGRIPELSKSKNWEWKLLKKVVNLADKVITMDMNSYETLKKNGFQNVDYCPNPISLQILNFIYDVRPKVEKQSNKIVFVGHVLPTKGVFELVQACSQIENVEVHIIGKAVPAVSSELERIAIDKNDGKWMKLRGELSHDKVIEEMLSASVFVLPTYTEGFPNVILESMACACSIVTTPVGAIPEMIDANSNNPCGILVPVGDVASLRDAIVAVLNDVQLAREYAKRAERKVRQEYSMDKIWMHLENIWINITSEEIV